MNRLRLVAFFLLAVALPAAYAAPKDEKKADRKSPTAAESSATDDVAFASPEAEALDKSLAYKGGVITIGDGLATLNIPDSWRYLDPAQTERLIVEGWGNPPGTKTLGMLVPAAVSPLTAEGWGVVVTFQEDGYVEDKDAENINYDELLKGMQEGTKEQNEERKKQGYGAIELVGWAESPHYDKATNKLYWAQELAFDGSPEHSLNYDIRALGRRGVLSLNAVAGMRQLDTVQSAMPQVLGFVEFNEGHRYADFKAGTDKVAAYGIGALIAGGVAAKAGLFKVLLAALLGAKKFVIIGVIALGAFLVNLFRRKTGGE